MMSVSTPLSPSWDAVLSLSPMSAYRDTDKEPENQGLHVLVCVCVCLGVCVCEREGKRENEREQTTLASFVISILFF